MIAVIATALCAVIGGGINVLVVEVQQIVPGLGNYVLLAIGIAGLLALLISFIYSSLSTSMPVAGGEYIYVSRSLSPGWAFAIAFIKFIGAVLSVGSVAYMDVLIAQTAFRYAGLIEVSNLLSNPFWAMALSVGLIMFFFYINYKGLHYYTASVVLLASIMILGGIIFMFIGFTHSQAEFEEITNFHSDELPEFNIFSLFNAVAIMFWAYIGFTSIAQSAGEIKEPEKNMPRAFIITTILVALYYFTYTSAVYHAVPWQYMEVTKNANVPGLLGVFIPQWLAIVLSFIIFLTLANDIPPMLYTKSRLVYSWAVDGIIPKFLSKVNKEGIPYMALLFVSLLASIVAALAAFGHLFEEVGLTVFSRFIIYASVALSLIYLPYKNREIYKRIKFMKSRWIQVLVASIVILFSLSFFFLMVYEDIKSSLPIYKTRTFYIFMVGLIGYIIYRRAVFLLKKKNVNVEEYFANLP